MKNRLLRSLAMLALCSSGAAANTIGNLVFHDVNDNGTYEAGTDAPIDGVTLQLFNSGDDPTVATPVATATSGGGGIYSFAGVTDGTYFIYIPLTEFVHGKVLFDKTTATGAPDPGDAVDNDDNGKIEETHRGTITDDFSVSGGGTVNTIDFGFITRVLIDWDDPNNQWGFVLDTPEADGSITSTGDLDGTGNPYFTDISGTGVDMNVTLAGQDPDNDLSDAPGDRDELTEWLNADSKHAGIMPLFAHLGGEATFNLGYGEGSWDDCLLVEFDFTDTLTGAPVAVKDVSFKIFDIDKTNWTGPLGSEVSGRGLGWIDRVTIQGYAGASLVDPIYNHVNGAPVDDPVNNPYTSEPDGTAYMKVDGNSLEGRWEFSEKDASYTNNPDANNWNTSGTYGAASGNVDVSFASPITKFTWKHENLWSDGTTNRTSPDPYWGGHSMEIGLSDIAFTVTAALGDYVWIDLDRDGEQDPLEPPLEGVLVELLDDSGTPILTTTTDASGAYFFADIPLGDYTVRFTPPVGGGYIASPADQGGDDALDSDIDASGVTGVLNITSVQTDITVDAGFIPPGGVLGDFVFLDTNANGEQDPGELGIEGVTVNLLDEFGAPVLDGSGDPITTTTNADGVYFFSGLVEGDYIVEFVPPANHVASPQDQGGQDDSDSDIDPVTFRTDPVNVGADESVLDVDAGFYELVSLGDFVFNDANGDGVRDSGEIGLPGVTVNLLDGNGDPVDDASGDPITTVTDGSGAYLFEGLDPGDYIVEFVQPTGFGTVAQDAGGDTIDSDYDPGTGETAVISLAPGDDDSSTDAGFLPPDKFAQIGDTVWEDLNRDGIQDPGEPTVSGVTVKLLDSFGNPVTDTQGNPVTTTTDANGNYYFIVDPLNDYFIEFEPPAGYTVTAQDAGSDETADSDADPVSFRTDLIVVGDNEVNLDIDAGLVGASIGDRVWVDLDRNGEQDPGEPGLAGVTVELLDDLGNPVLDGSGNAITTTTDADGNYELTGFDPGIYTVRFTASGYTPTDDNKGDDALDSDIDLLGVTGLIDMTGPGSDTTVDAGFLPRGSALGDFVFTDANADGEQDPGETGIAGVTVNLLNASGTPILDGSGNPVTTTTNADGYYYFDDLVAGDYIVEFVAPADHLVSPQDAADDKRDSDIDPVTLRTDVVSLAADDSDLDVDAGFYPLGSIGNYVFNDADNDGIQDEGEIGIPGVVVSLLDGNGDPFLDEFGSPVTTVTDVNGFYEFTGLLPGDYIVDFSTPNGFTTVNPDQTTDDLDSDYNVTTGQTPVITLALGENNEDVDAGYRPPGNFVQLGDTVWSDLNGDGIQDPGEPGVEGVVVKLLDGNGDPVLDADGNETTVTTDVNGNYLFILNPASDYMLEFVPPPGASFTLQGEGTDATADSDVDPVTNRTGVLTFSNGEINLDIDAGVLVTNTLGDTVWVDLDDDGVQDPHEPGLEGVTVELLDANGDPVLDGSGNPYTATTDSSGNYEISDFPPGTYRLRFTPPGGETPTSSDQGGDDALDSDIDGSGLTGLLDMTEPQGDLTVDAGFLPVIPVIGDFVFNDANQDGVQDPGELGVEGAIVNLLDGNGDPVLDGSGNPLTTTTGPDGGYYFDDLAPGDYIVEVIPPQDYVVSPQYQGGDTTLDSDIDPATNRSGVVTLSAGEFDATVDIGLYQLGSIGDYVFNDVDGDGVQDPTEFGLPGVVVNLLDGNGDPVLDGSGDPITTTSDASGFYSFTGLPAGDYRLEFVTPDGFQNVDPDKTTEDLDSDYDKGTGLTPVISLGLGEAIDDVDAGFKPPGGFAQIGDTVWEDLDGDGIQDPGEPGVEGVVVKLLDDQGAPILDDAGNETTVTTDADGKYRFIVDPGNDYILEFVPPGATEVTVQDAGTDETEDSDVDPITYRTGLIALENDELNLDLDLGLVGARIGDTVWVDLDGDGVQDPNEGGMVGVLVELLDENGDPVLDGSGNPITATSDSSGNYEITGFPPGSYRLRFTPPDGQTPTTADQGGDDALDSDIDGSGLTGLIDMTGPGSDLTVDAGFLPVASGIGDVVFNDLDGDGIQDPGEPGLEGVTVNLLDGNGDPVLDGSGNPVTTTTTATGAYFFDGLDAGNYIVEFVPPQDHAVSPKDAGSDDTADSDIDPVTNRSDVIALGASEFNTTVDAGFYQLASFGDFVWNDDGDGKQEAGEIGLPGVVVNLLDSNGAPVLDGSGNAITTTTDASGFYEFTGLVAGDYRLEFITPGGFKRVDWNKTTDDLDSDYDKNTGITDPITLTQGENNIDVDAGFQADFGNFAQLGSTVWDDLDGDGIQDPGEPGVEGVVVKLLDDQGDPILDGSGNETTVITDANGDYLFIVDPSNDYILEFVPPPGESFTAQGAGTDGTVDSDVDPGTNQTGLIVLENNEIKLDIDAGLAPAGGNTIGDYVWIDTNGDGVQDGSETGLNGVTVTLLDSNGDPTPFTTVTANNGSNDGAYEFIGVPDGTYSILFEAPGGTNYVISPQDSGTDDTVDSDPVPATGETAQFAIGPDETNLTFDAGMYDPVSIEGSVFVNDGAGNQPLGGVTLILLDENGDPVLDGGGQPVTTTSDPSTGAYSFGGLPPGTYQVGQLQPDGYLSTTDTDGANNNVIGDETPITLASGQSSSGNDFVESTAPPTGAIGNYVWLDENGDGIQDAGEAGIPGVTVHLRDSGGNIIATTTTDANGGYIFTNVLPGDYTVEVEGASLPTGLNLTSDPDTTADGQHPVTLGEGEEYLSADFGYNFVPASDSSNPSSGATGSIGDTVWNDANGDGVQDPGESGIEGVTVTLLTDDNGDGIYGGAGDNPPTTTTTDASGNYVFDDLAPGGYVVEVTPPAGYTQTGDPDGILDDAVSVPIVLAPGDVITIADFGYDLDSGGATIGDTIYLDVNGNGTHDPGTDLGIAGVTVALLDAAGNVIATTTTDENGTYSFPGLPTGVDYTVVVTDTENVLGELAQIGDPDGGNDGQSTVTALAADDLNQDFGYAPPGHGSGDGMIGDTVFLDGNGDNLPDSGEGVEGVTVELYDAGGTVLLATTTTDENGNYRFGGLDPAGTYTVNVVTTGTILDGLSNTVDPDTGGDSTSVVDLSASSGINLDQDFGYVPAVPNTIGGTIWEDINADGDLDESGTGIEGVTVVLLDPNGNMVATTTTDPNGDYSFPNLPDGTYTVDVTDDGNLLDGTWHSDGPNDGLDNNSQDDPYTVTVSGGATDTTGDFGYYVEPAVLGNFIFDDLDGDGIQDGGEPGIGGVVVTLTVDYPNGDTVVVSTTTAPDGSYTFIGLLDESFNGSGGVGEPVYTVTVATPDRYAPSPANVGGDDTIDSDNGVAGEEAELVQGGVDFTNDFGFVKLKATNYDDFITDAGLDPNAPDGSGQPLPDGSGTGGNPDGDYSSNLLEHAFCDTPNSGVPNHQGFCVELANAATGQMDASFIRAEGIEDVIYTLQGADSMLGPWFTIATIPAGQPAGGGFVAVSNGDQTETVTYANVQNDAGYADTGFGFARLCVSLDSEPDGTPDTIVLPSDGSSVEATDYTKMFGWQCVDYNVGECASCSQPFTNKPVFTGTVDGNAAATATVDATGSAGGVNLATLNLGPIDLDPGVGVQLVPTHYLQVTSGALEGERFDIAGASGGVLTLENDPDIFAAGDGVRSLNTSSGVPADDVLLGATFQVLPHKTIDQLFDKNGAFAGLQSVSDETRLLFYESRVESPGFATLSLADTGSGVKWVYLGDSGEIDQGSRPVDRTTGNYIHSTVGGTTVCGAGLVADYDLAYAINEGYNLAGAPYPISQTPNGINGRGMSVGSAAGEFNGAGTPSQASELYLWRGDAPVDSLPAVAPYIEGYESFMAASDGGSFEQWVNPTDPTLADLGSDPSGPLLLPSWRAVTIKMTSGNALEPHIYPLPPSGAAPGPLPAQAPLVPDEEEQAGGTAGSVKERLDPIMRRAGRVTLKGTRRE